jgi:hypothetical protein
MQLMGERSSQENLPRVLSVIELLTEDELRQLNQLIVARLRLMQQIRAHGDMMNFRLGQRVRFTGSAGQIVRGVIAKYNRKSVTIVADEGGEWLVAPSLLQAE